MANYYFEVPVKSSTQRHAKSNAQKALSLKIIDHPVNVIL